MSSTNNTTIRDALKRKPQPKLLRKLADFLENEVEDSKFDMGSFCGTARCAFGHAPSIPAIGKLVKIKRVSYALPNGGRRYYPDIRTVDPKIETKIGEARYSAAGREAREWVDNFDRAQYVFGITETEANTVFGESLHATTRADVAHELRELASKYDGKRA